MPLFSKAPLVAKIWKFELFLLGLWQKENRSKLRSSTTMKTNITF